MAEVDMTTFFADGFAQGQLQFDTYAFDDLEFPQIDYDVQVKLSEYQKQQLDKIKTQLELVLKKTFPEFKLTEEPGFWQGVTKENNEFHNDFTFGDKFNSNILVYLEEGTMENDNYIEVLGVDKCRIYPLRGDFVWLNQQPQFEHRANNGEGIRRVIHFPYYIPSLDNKDKK